jgi:hypothetical protein
MTTFIHALKVSKMTNLKVANQLLKEACDLYIELDKRQWQASYDQDIPLYNRLKRLCDKALARYHERFKKYAGYFTSGDNSRSN